MMNTPASFILRLLVSLLPAVFSLTIHAQGMRPRASFAPVFEKDGGSINTLVPRADGQYYAVGNFTSINGVRRLSVARFLADDSLDQSWVPAAVARNYAGADVLTAALDNQGRLVIGGTFGYVGGQKRLRLARLNADGSLDASFETGSLFSNYTVARVTAIGVENDSQIVVAAKDNRSYPYTSERRFVRLNVNGSVDPTFVTGSGFDVESEILVINNLLGGKFLVGGQFTSYQGVARNSLVRLNEDGSLDTSFQLAPEVTGTVRSVLVTTEGKILVGGSFPKGLLRLNSDGSLDSTFAIGSGFTVLSGTITYGGVTSLAFGYDGKIVVGGNFNFIQGKQRTRLAVLHANGVVDDDFTGASPTYGATSILPVAAMKYLVNSGGTPGRYNTLGQYDTTYTVKARLPGLVTQIHPAPGGQWIAAGQFGYVNGVARAAGIARLHPDGSLDATFNAAGGQPNPAFTDVRSIRPVAVQPDGKVVHSSNSASGQQSGNIGRFNADGSTDQTFNLYPQSGGLGNGIARILRQSDGKIVASAHNSATLYRLQSNGSFDVNRSLQTPLANAGPALALQSDGKLLTVGYSSPRIARLNADFTVDSTFDPGTGFNGAPNALAVQSDEKILVAGSFSSYRGIARTSMARLTASGALDETFSLGGGPSGEIHALTLTTDGKILVGGGFLYFNNIPRMAVVRLNVDGSVDTGFSVPSAITQDVNGFSPGAVMLQTTTENGVILVGERFDYTNFTGLGLVYLEPVPAPTITTPPAARSATVGDEVTFTVTATDPTSYQWKRGDITLPSGTGATLRLTNITTADAGDYTVTVTNTAGSVTSAAATLTVAKGTPVLSWAAPVAIFYGTTLSSTQLNATAGGLAGTFSYTPDSGTLLPAGTQTLSVSFTPTDTTNYNSGSATVSLTVNKFVPALTWATPAPIAYGTALSATQLNATAGGLDGTFSYSPAAGTVLGVGTDQTLSVTFSPTDTANYTAASSSTTITVTKASPTINWATPAAISYGTALSSAQLNASTVGNIPGTFSYTPAAGIVLEVGQSQTLSVTFTPSDTSLYNNASGTVTLNVNKAAPTLTWLRPGAITYGTALSSAELNATASVPGTFAYNPPSGSVLDVGANQALSVTFTPTDTARYSSATTGVLLTVNKATPSLVWSNPSAITYGTPLSGTQLNASTVGNLAGTYSYSPASGTVMEVGADQSLSVTFSPSDSIRYNSVTTSVMISVGKATPVVTWPSPSAIPYGTALSSTQLNASTGTPGVFTYDPPAGTILTAGAAQLLSASFTPSDSTRYTAATASTTLTVTSADAPLTWAAPSAILRGTPLSWVQLGAASTIPGTHVYTPGEGTVLAAGLGQTLSVTFTPTDTANYAPVTRTVSLDVIAPRIRAISTSYQHTLLITAEGELWGATVGGNSELGLGDSSHSPVFKRIATAVVSASAGGRHSVFLKTDGTLWGMGLNAFGELGNGTTTRATTPIQIASGVKAFAAGAGHTAFIKNDDTLWTVGWNGWGQLGRADGLASISTTPAQVATGVRSVAAGRASTFIIKTDGTLWGVGANDQGQLGDGTTTDRSAFVPIASNVKSAACGVGHSVFIKNNDTLWASGDNVHGQLGDGTTTDRTTHVQIATQVTSAHTGWYHTVFIKNDGTLWSMGFNGNGQLGDGTGGAKNTRSSPFKVADDVTLAAAGEICTLFLKSTGALWGSGNPQASYGSPLPGEVLSPIQVLDGIPLLAQTIAFDAIADRTFNPAAATVALTASSSAGLTPITFAVASGPATVSGSTLTITGAGIITVTALQAGDATYAAATATRTFTVADSVPVSPFQAYLTAAGVPSNQQGANDDPEGDGMPNLLEFALGGDPMVPNGAGSPTCVLTAGNLTLTYVRAQPAAVTYEVQTTTDLTANSWTATGVTQGTPAGDGTTTASIPYGTGPRYLRLRVTVTP